MTHHCGHAVALDLLNTLDNAEGGVVEALRFYCFDCGALLMADPTTVQQWTNFERDDLTLIYDLER